MRRGGIPVCFPQFGGFGPLGQHGFARNSEFAVTDSAANSVTLSLTPSEDQLQLFPHLFELKVKVSTCMISPPLSKAGQSKDTAQCPGILSISLGPGRTRRQQCKAKISRSLQVSRTLQTVPLLCVEMCPCLSPI